MKYFGTTIIAACLVGQVVGDAAALRRALHSQLHRLGKKGSSPDYDAGNTTSTAGATGSSSLTCTRPTVTVYVSGNATWSETPKLPDPTVMTVTATESMCMADSTSAHMTNSYVPPLSYANSTSSPLSATISSAATYPSGTTSSSTTEQPSSEPPSSSSVAPAAESSTSLAPVPPPRPTTPVDACDTAPTNYTSMQPFFGFDISNTKPVDPSKIVKNTTTGAVLYDNGPLPVKNQDDWENAVAKIKTAFPKVNSFRMYSTTDPASVAGKDVIYTHLANALPAAKKHDMKVLVGLWSGGVDNTARFSTELEYLDYAVGNFSCSNIAAVSVGNEDMNHINLLRDNYGNPLPPEEVAERKTKTATLLVQQIQSTRELLRKRGCCVPVTHTDTWNEMSDGTFPWLPSLISAVDQAVIANIFPFWSNDTVTNSLNTASDQSSRTLNYTRQFGKDLWLGETGWAIQDPLHVNQYTSDAGALQNYFQSQVGCQLLSGSGTAFYYIDWDQDAPFANRPSFGLWDWQGKPLVDIDCSTWKKEMRIDQALPSFMGGQGYAYKKQETRDEQEISGRSFWSRWWH